MYYVINLSIYLLPPDPEMQPGLHPDERAEPHPKKGNYNDNDYCMPLPTLTLIFLTCQFLKLVSITLAC